MPVFDLNGKEVRDCITGDLAIVMPIYNEAENIRSVIADWKAVLDAQGVRHTFVLLDDGSKDKTFQILQEMEKEQEGLVVVSKPNSGHGRTCRLGYNLCCASNIPWILQIDSDGQCDPVYFADFWKSREQVDCVFGIRKQRDDGRARALTSKFCRWTSTLLCGVDMVDPNVPYRLLRREALAEAVGFIPAGFDIHNVALTFVLKRMGNKRWAYIPIRFKDRQGGNNSIDLVNVAQLGFAMLFDLIKLKKRLPKI